MGFELPLGEPERLPDGVDSTPAVETHELRSMGIVGQPTSDAEDL
jgi:hypothetical protein